MGRGNIPSALAINSIAKERKGITFSVVSRAENISPAPVDMTGIKYSPAPNSVRHWTFWHFLVQQIRGPPNFRLLSCGVPSEEKEMYAAYRIRANRDSA